MPPLTTNGIVDLDLLEDFFAQYDTKASLPSMTQRRTSYRILRDMKFAFVSYWASEDLFCPV